MGFGVHVAVMMGTFYAMGHVAGGALHPNPIYVRQSLFDILVLRKFSQSVGLLHCATVSV